MSERLNYTIKIVVVVLILAIVCVVSLSYGESNIGFIESIKALLGLGDGSNINIVQKIRLPRVLAAIIAGVTLGLSGLFTRTALRNPLADSSILGIQSGASVFALGSLLVFPALAGFLPIAAFLGGLFAFILVISFSYKDGFNPLRLVLSGVAVNSFFAAIVSVITINHVNELQNSIHWTSGSLVGINLNEVILMGSEAIIAVLIAIACIPLLQLLKLEDEMLISLGKNPNLYRIIASIVAVLLASISLAYVGVIAFVGIIVPHVAQILVGNKLSRIFVMTVLLGALLIVSVDLFGRIVFMQEIPVGALIGVLGAPLFLYLLRGNKNGI